MQTAKSWLHWLLPISDWEFTALAVLLHLPCRRPQRGIRAEVCSELCKRISGRRLPRSVCNLGSRCLDLGITRVLAWCQNTVCTLPQWTERKPPPVEPRSRDLTVWRFTEIESWDHLLIFRYHVQSINCSGNKIRKGRRFLASGKGVGFAQWVPLILCFSASSLRLHLSWKIKFLPEY